MLKNFERKDLKYRNHDLIRLGGHLYNDGRFGYGGFTDFYYYDTDAKNYVYIKESIRDDKFYDDDVSPRVFSSLAEMLKHVLNLFRKTKESRS